jgi:integrase
MPSGAAVIRYEGKRGVVWRVKYADASGRQVMETVGREADGFTRKQAAAELRERLVRVERKGYERPAPVKFTDYSETWFEESQGRRDWKPQTVRAYRNALDRLQAGRFGGMALASIRPRDVSEYVRQAMSEKRTKTGKPLNAKTVNLDLTVLKLILTAAKRERLIDENPSDGMERPKMTRRRWRILEPVEVARVAQAFDDDRARTFFLTLMLTALRNSELRALRWRDVYLVDCVLRVRDSKSEDGVRSIALTPTLAEALWQHRRSSAFRGDDEYVFADPKRGARLNPTWFAEQLRAALKAAGIEEYLRPFHDLRHSSLTNEAAAGSNPIALMTKAGHSSMQTTQIYLHLAGQVFRDEAAALEERLLGGRTFYPSGVTSGDPEEPRMAREAVATG